MKKYNNLIFEDDFSLGYLDSNKWNVTHLGNGFGNKEWQFYRSDSDNVKVINNQLVITGKKEDYEHCHYTSAKITTKDKFSFKYGRVDIVASLPKGKGLWPALWMMPQFNTYGHWPHNGEIDIMESLGHDPDYIYCTIHYGLPHQYHGFTKIIERSNDFHKYSLIWEEGIITWLIDDEIVGSTSTWFSKNYKDGKEINNKFPAPFDHEFYLIINLAIGGNFSGYPDETTKFNAELVIDSVRVYK